MPGTLDVAGVAHVEHPHRHPAMSGINVSPVHGRYCICGRCAPPGPKPS